MQPTLRPPHTPKCHSGRPAAADCPLYSESHWLTLFRVLFQEVESPSYPDIQAHTAHSWFSGTMLDWKPPPREQPASLCLSEACKHDSQPRPPGDLSMFPSAPAALEESSFLHKGHCEFSSAGESTPWLRKKNPLSLYFFCYLVCSHSLFSFCFPRSSGKYRFERKFQFLERQRQGMQKCMCNSNAWILLYMCKVYVILMHEYFYIYVKYVQI